MVGRATSVVIVDDHPLFLEAMAHVVKRLPDADLVGRAASGAEAIAQVRAMRPDVLVLDLHLGDMTGIEVLAQLARDGIEARVLCVSGSLEPQDACRLVEAGVHGLIEKDASFGEIGEAIMRVARGETVMSNRVQAALMGTVRDRRDRSTALLSDRELEILNGLAQGLSAPDLGRRLHLSPSTVKTYLQRLYEKLGVSDRAAAVAEGMRRQLIE